MSTEDPQVAAAQDRGIEVIKHAQLVGRMCPAGRTLAVAGTHGKTTTSWMLHGALANVGGRRRARSSAAFTATTA